jgi:hypothetical protein
MRVAALLSFAVVTAVATPAFAVTEARRVACRDLATEVANEWAAGEIYLAADEDTPEASEVTVIAGGKKYFVPREGRGVIKSVGTRIWQRKQVYIEEYRRCLRDPNFGLSSLAPEPEKSVN